MPPSRWAPASSARENTEGPASREWGGGPSSCAVLQAGAQAALPIWVDVDEFERLCFDQVAVHGGRVVKMVGDEVMFATERLVGQVQGVQLAPAPVVRVLAFLKAREHDSFHGLGHTME